MDTSTIRRVFPIRHFFTKIVGVTHENSDGSSRQAFLEFCTNGDQLALLREKKNRYSAHAVAVFTSSSDQLGYLPDEVAEMTVEEMKQGCAHVVFINETGRGVDGIYWATLLVFVAEDVDTDLKEVMRYMLEQFAPADLPKPVWQRIQSEIDKDEH